MPRTNTDYWGEKLEGNVRRFEAQRKALTKLGLRVIVVWECQLDAKTLRRLATRLAVQT